MKIRTYYSNKLPKGKHVIEWVKTQESCAEPAYLVRVRQEHNPDNWFRNLKVLGVTTETVYSNLTYQRYSIEYERKVEYWEADVPSSALTAILRDDSELGVIHRDGALWLDYIGE